MDQINILVTDDEREIADLLEIYLVSDGSVSYTHLQRRGCTLENLGKLLILGLKAHKPIVLARKGL